ncbi:Rieske (2Fe-2S) protein [Corynebacterium heidelbergense]|uniref:Iron-sulfur protein n=1 Tax=Corynebacterium heidelbergense TaxID=2055947 RepID=A0A364V495_9CORY|nr:Rieske (2Fe-2S) protein [Corynebacterium heidelbergense]RAV31465.1 iron-sulfur protein [Corynebacterium heidelbergense]
MSSELGFAVPCSRRAFLKGVAVTTAATASGALLAACASEKTVAKAKAAQVPVGGAVFVDDWIVAQPKEGTFTAFSNVCPHARGKIDHTEEVNGVQVAVCPKHGSEFSLSDGSVLKGPSRDPLTAAKGVTKNGDSVEVSN